jgi:hypothetical protein
MSERAQNQLKQSSLASIPVSSGVLQRKCACGNHKVAGGECSECEKKKSGLQRKVVIGANNDPLEREADQVADRILATPAHYVVSASPPRIRGFLEQSKERIDTAPASIDQVLASPGKPLEPVLRRDMEQRFGYDFSSVRVHADAAAGQSAQDVNANAYTVGQDIVFGAGRFAPSTHEGRRLMAHELAHVVQQTGAAGSAPKAQAQDRTDQHNTREMRRASVRMLQRQPQSDDTDHCPRGEIRLGPGLPCIPLILPGRKCPIGQVEFGGSCVSLQQRPTLLGGTLKAPSVILPSPPSATQSKPAGTTGTKSARVVRIDNLRGCAYTVTYSNPREVDCNTAFRNQTGRNPPEPLCGVSLVYDITSVSASGSGCPAKLEGLKVSEVVKGNQGCTPPGFVWPAPNPCVIGAGGKISGCTDTFTLCGPTSNLSGNGCTEIVDQEIEVGGQLAEEHEIIFDLKKNGKNCTGKVTRN